MTFDFIHFYPLRRLSVWTLESLGTGTRLAWPCNCIPWARRQLAKGDQGGEAKYVASGPLSPLSPAGSVSDVVLGV